MFSRRFRPLVKLALFNTRSAREEMDEEIRFHLETRAALLVERGYSPEAAMIEARRRFGAADESDLRVKRRQLQDSAARREDRMRLNDRIETVVNDIRYALRGLRHSPGFAVAVIATLALGIGANTAIFSVVRGVLLRPLPYGDADRIVVVWNHWTNQPRTWLSQPEIADYTRQRSTFERFAAFSRGAMNVTGGNSESERANVGFVQAPIFDVLGVKPLAGRTFTAAEDEPNGPLTAMLMEDFWQRRYAGDRSIIGTTIELNARSFTVVGILRHDFRLPLEFAGEHAQLIVPMQLGPPDESQRGSHGYNAVAKLAPGLSVTQAQKRMDAFMTPFKKDHPQQYNADFGVTLFSIGDQVHGEIKPILFVLLGAVSFVLLIGCANVANLLLARAEGRTREIAVRTALGASHRRVAMQLLTESVVLGVLGGALGLLLAWRAVALLTQMSLANMPRLDAVAVDGGVLAYTLGVSVLTGILFGLAPVAHMGRGDLTELLKQGRGNTAGRARARVRRLLVVAELALAVVALIGATLMTRSFVKLMSVPPGFASDHVLTLRLSPPQANYRSSSSVRGFYDRILGETRRLPSVRTAGAISGLPLVGTIGDWNFDIDGAPAMPPGTQGPTADWEAATPGYFETMRIPIVRGRAITEADRIGAQPVAVISEATARQYFDRGEPLGRRIKLGGSADSVWRTIVGVAGDVKHGGLDKDSRTTMYIPYAQFLATVPDSFGSIPRVLNIVVRTAGDPIALAASVREIVKQVDPNVPLARIRALDDIVATSVSTPRLATILLVSFGGLSLLLAALGVYGVMSYVVAQRTNEIGIRVALGARASDVVRLVMWQGMRPVILGIVLGAIVAYSGARFMSGVLFGVRASDPLSFATAILALCGIAALAIWRPARRASGVDPIAALRAE